MSNPSKPTILVIGLLPGQMNRVERDCQSVATLKFSGQKKNGGLRGIADHCIVMTKFVSHAQSIQAFKQFPRERVHLKRGGLTVLVQAINDIASHL